MTAATLQQSAGWDPPELRAGVGRLGQVPDRLVPWRARLDALGRRLGTAECWSGPAGTVAAAALVELSTVATRVCAALLSSHRSLLALLSAAEEAHVQAAAALAGAAAVGAGFDAEGRLVGLPLPPAGTMAPDQVAAVEAAREAGVLAAARAELAVGAAGRALAYALEAQQPLTGLAVDGGGPVGFPDLAARLGAVPGVVGPPPAPGTDPQSVAAWWTGLTAAEQLAAIGTEPGRVGALDGLPAWARDRANRRRLATALEQLPPGAAGHDTAAAVTAVLERLAAGGSVGQLLQFDPARDQVAVSVGDLDTAAAVGLLVPGIETTPADDLDALVADAGAVSAAAAAAAPGLAVAAVAWLGYRTPRLAGSVPLAPGSSPLTAVYSPTAAMIGGPALDRVLDGQAAARGTPGAVPAPRTTVVAHSYGTAVTGRAARAPGRLAADAVVLLGSPGTTVQRADRLEVEEVYGAWSPSDPISWCDFYGPSPFDSGFGDTPLPTEPTEGHTDYYDADRPTLTAIGEVVAGVRDDG